jgi:magnesium transporter
LLRSKPEERVSEIMVTRLITVGPDDDLGEVAETFQKYSILGCPVVDAEMRMMGVILLKHAFDELLPEFRREA